MRWTSEQVRVMRRHVGMTQQAFSEALGVSMGMVYRWEADKSRPGPAWSRLLSDTFGRPLDQRRDDGVAA
jgi:DNA-binding transcriptional regulator YiaG